MDSSFEMLHRSSYIPIYPYPLSVSSEISSFRSNNNILTNDYLSYYPDNTTYPSTIYTNSRSHSPINHPDTPGISYILIKQITVLILDIDRSIHRYNNTGSSSSSSCLVVSRSERCLVCNDRSSGIHFGISTCEACKAFFRRTSLSSYSIPLPCSPTRCEINTKNRNNCPSCRFDKCKRLGMDRENVIYGKPSKQQVHSLYHQDYLTNISNQLIKMFQDIHSLSLHSFIITNENKQQLDHFGQIAFELFYQQTSQIYVSSFFHLRKKKIFQNQF
jgi:hypothetical protein